MDIQEYKNQKPYIYYDKPRNKNKEIVGYIIYYGDGKVKKVDRGLLVNWIKSPKDNIQVVMLYENTDTRVKVNGYDYYYFNGLDFVATNDTKKIKSKLNPQYMKYGWYVEWEKYIAICEKALSDKL